MTLLEDTAGAYYDALLAKDPNYEGVFFVGVKTTGIFCRPTCPARKPKFENCEFFKSAQDALIASYHPCKLKSFKTPLHLIGSEFQKRAWHALLEIPYGQTRSYLNQAKAIGNEKAFRAVANANGANQLAIVVPCHRIINHNGELGGYGGGKVRKTWLINHEKQYA